MTAVMTKRSPDLDLDTLDGLARRATDTVKRETSQKGGTLPVLRNGTVVDVDLNTLEPVTKSERPKRRRRAANGDRS